MMIELKFLHSLLVKYIHFNNTIIIRKKNYVNLCESNLSTVISDVCFHFLILNLVDTLTVIRISLIVV